MRDVEAYAYIIAKNRGGVSDVRFVMAEEILERLYKHPLCTLGTDGLYRGGPNISHPRAFGSFPRYLGRFVREKKILSYEEAIRRITGLPADRYELKNKGYIKEGYDADLVLFDPQTIGETNSFERPHSYPKGIDLVIVNGRIVVAHGIHTGDLPGIILRKQNGN